MQSAEKRVNESPWIQWMFVGHETEISVQKLRTSGQKSCFPDLVPDFPQLLDPFGFETFLQYAHRENKPVWSAFFAGIETSAYRTFRRRSPGTPAVKLSPLFEFLETSDLFRTLCWSERRCFRIFCSFHLYSFHFWPDTYPKNPNSPLKKGGRSSR